MSDARQVPGPAQDNNERIVERPADDFARLPREEVHPVSEPGAGPRGGLDDGPRLPLVLVGVGMLIAFATFVVRTPIALAVGLVLVVAGAIWSGVRSTGSSSGTGPATFDEPRGPH